MTHHNTPDAFTTHGYISESIDLLGKTQNLAEHHGFRTDLRDTSTVIATPHQFDAKLLVPHRFNDRTGSHGRRGARVLTLTLLGASMDDEEHRRRTAESDDDLPTAKSLYLGSSVVTPHLARLHFMFDSKKLISTNTQLFTDGYLAGIEDQDAATKAIIGYWGDIARSGIRSYRQLASLTQDISLVGGTSTLESRVGVDIRAIAGEIQKESGVPIPNSLSANVPHVHMDTKAQMTFAQEQPYAVLSEILIDHITPDYGQRVFTHYFETEYRGQEPDATTQQEHLAFTETADASGETYYLGLDARQDTLHLGGERRPNTETEASDARELRQMMQPFIQSVVNLRRYANKAYAGLDQQLD